MRRIDCSAPEALWVMAMVCGATPINGLLCVARRRGMQAKLIDLRNSGDTAGDRSRVVGYAAFAFFEAGTEEVQHVH